jgi:hypothetical protein
MREVDKEDIGKINLDLLLQQIKEAAELYRLEKLMEEMANAPKEEMGKREPGEPCTYAGERHKIQTS